MSQKLIHVIVLNWNGKDVIEECLESLSAVDYSPIEITVVDNASTDSSLKIVRERFPQVNIIRNKENLLFAGGNNVGLRKCIKEGGELFLLLNNDTVAAPDFISEMIRVFERPDAGIAGAKIYYFDNPERIWYGGGGFYPLIALPRHLNIRKLDRGIDKAVEETGYVTGCAMMIRREVLEQIGLLDPGYEMYCEDVDFCLRALKAGWKSYYSPEAHVWHKVSSSSGGGFTPYKLEKRIVSTYRLFRLHKSRVWRILVFPLYGFLFVLLAFAFSLSWNWALFRSLFKGVRGVFDTMRNM
ncbi:MAG: glycosyltransferase family 2 protein [Candidatus Krumholzibacteriota bacterium]|nr:glycosyltransferase family 2 protein [Candidatus Krumholzibacteriota bacterium]